MSKDDHEDLKSTAPMTVGRVVPASGEKRTGHPPGWDGPAPTGTLAEDYHLDEAEAEERGGKRTVAIPGWTGPTGHPPTPPAEDSLFQGPAKRPDLEVRRVFLAAENKYVFAVVADLRISRFTDDDTWSAEFQVLATFVDTLEGARSARDWLEGYLQGLSRR